MKTFLFLLICSFLYTNSIAGSGTAFLTCKSESGRTMFHAELQDIVGLLEGAELNIDGSVARFNGNDAVYTIFDPKNGVLTLYIEGKTSETNNRYIQFWAIPSTFKIIKNERAHQIYEFKAKIYGSDPRPGKDARSPEIELICRLEYKI